MKKYVRLSAREQVAQIEAHRNFVRLSVNRTMAQIEMSRLQQSLAGEAFINSIIYN